jgi:hypothetical protein
MRSGIFIFILFLYTHIGWTQIKVVKGNVQDIHSEEPIPFASVVFPKNNIGQLTDSAGNFMLRVNGLLKADSISVSYVGYQTKKIALPNAGLDTLFLVIRLERAALSKEVIIKSKYSKGWIVWRRILKNKVRNDRARFENYSYELYNKLELDISGFNANRFKKLRLVRPFGFIIDQTVDTISDEKPLLPIFISESISDLYYQRNPLRKREEIKASRTSGIKNESIQKMLGGMNINDNIYSNYINVFDKRFISPVADNGDIFYDYRLPDTQYVAGKRFLHLIFTPKHKGENTFEGECWVHDSTYAIQKVSLHLSKDANVNFVNNYAFIQEYKHLGDSVWFLAKDKLVIDFSPLGKEKFGIIAKKTTTYKDARINNGFVWERVRKNKTQEDIIMLESASSQNDQFWKDSRHESLSRNESAIYAMVDTLEKLPIFKTYKNTIEFLATGYKSFGKFEYGPWFNAFSVNAIEGYRVRLDMGTSNKFSKKWRLAGYLAYGTLDQKFKGRAEVTHIIKKTPRTSVFASYVDDYDNGQVYYDEVGMDNVFTLAARKQQIPIKFLRVRQEKFEFFKETSSGFSFEVNATRKEFTPVRALPDASIYSKNATGGGGLINTEVSLKLRFAYLERFLEGDFFRTSLGSPYPISELRYSKGIAGVLGGGYDYHKLNVAIHDYQKVAHYGELYYNVFAGKIWGTLPFPMLEVHPGNEIYYYNKYAFNLMNRFEYLSDEYAGINVEHNIGAGIFRLFGPSRKMKLRQFWNAKVLFGRLSEENKKLNQFGTVFDQGHQFQSLDGKTYMELGTGVNNIFKFIRIDLVWRVLPLPFPKELYKQFGVFGSFRLQF